MDITFLIGNGFDIALGLETKYASFLPIYIDSASPNENVALFKQQIRQDLKNWADVELAFGKLTEQYPEEDWLLFRDNLINFTREFSIYLKKQDSRLDSEDSIKIGVSRLDSGLIHFQNHLRLVQRTTVGSIFSTYSYEIHTYNFINFNYTYLLDNCINKFKESGIAHQSARSNAIRDIVMPAIHIHGTYQQDMLLGVNDLSQIANESFVNELRLTQLFVKPQANQFQKTGVHEACEALIRKSRIIIIYGMSLGKTDEFWWKLIIEWMQAEANRQLIILQYKCDFDASLRESYVDCVEDVYLLLHSYGLTQQQRQNFEGRIHISISNNILGEKIL